MKKYCPLCYDNNLEFGETTIQGKEFEVNVYWVACNNENDIDTGQYINLIEPCGFFYISDDKRDIETKVLSEHPFMCVACGKYWADYPDETCVGCDAYAEHTNYL